MTAPEEKRRKAYDILYDRGLFDRLALIGQPHIIGSCRMNLMAWNDLDIDIENQSMSKEKLYELTAYILKSFSPTWFEAKEEISDEGKNIWFHGFEAIIDGELWNFDLWFFDKETIQKAEAYCDRIIDLCERQPGSRDLIIQMKQKLIAENGYGFGKVTSMDVYQTVLGRDALQDL